MDPCWAASRGCPAGVPCWSSARRAALVERGVLPLADHDGLPLSHLVELLRAGRIDPQVTTLPLHQAAEAHRRLEAGQVIGELALTS